MKPEVTRMDHFNAINSVKHNKIVNISTSRKIDLDVEIRYNDEDDISYSVIDDIVSVIDLFCHTIDRSEASSFVDKLTITFIDSTTVFVTIDVYKYMRGLFFGRKMANIFSMKRLISNISANRTKIIGKEYAITIDVVQ